MKKKLLGFLSLLLAAVLLCACNKENTGGKETGTDGKIPQSTAKDEQEKAAYDDTLLEDISYGEGVYENPQGDVCYHYRLPALKKDRADAEAFDKLVDEATGYAVQNALDAMEAGELPGHSTVAWQSSWNGPVLSLLFTMNIYPFEHPDYAVLCYDMEKEQPLTGSEFLAAAGLSAEDVTPVLRRSTLQEFDRVAAKFGMFSDVKDAVSSREIVMLEENLDPEHLMFFPDENGRLCALVPFPTGPVVGKDYHFIPVTETKKQEPLSAEWNYVSAGLREDGQVFLTFHENDDLPFYIGAAGHPVRTETPYPVEGLYGVYKDMMIYMMGDDLFSCPFHEFGMADTRNIYLGLEEKEEGMKDLLPYLCLTDENGQVTFCNILKGAQHGYFCAEGPLPEPSDIDYCMAGSGAELLEIIAIGDYDRAVLSEYAVPAQYKQPDLSADSVFRAGDGSVLAYTADGDCPYWEVVDAENRDLTGVLSYMGLTEEGQVYSYWLVSEEDDILLEGVLAIRSPYLQDDSSCFTVKLLAGSPLMGAVPGEVITLDEIF